MTAHISSSARDAFRDEISQWGRAERPVLFWRDDDLGKWSPQLDWCLAVAEKRDISVAFAAIPTRLTQRASEAVCASPRGRLAVHGYRHQNHVANKTEASEYPALRGRDSVLAELRAATALLQYKARERFLNMFVPPWGRFDPSFNKLLRKAGFVCFSGNTQSQRFAVPLQLDCQITTEQARAALDLDVILEKITRQLQLRRFGHLERRQPLGLMTHHETFDQSIVDQLSALLDFVGESGFSFADFAEIDALSLESGRVDTPPRAPSEAPSSGALALLSERTLPDEGQSYPGLGKLLTLLAGMSPVALLRFVHLQSLAQRLPDSARILSAGCGKAVAEVALAMMNPRQRWVAVDVDPARSEKMRVFCREMDVSNIIFETHDIERLPAGSETLAPCSFDGVAVVEVLVYLSDPAAAVRSLGRLLRSGGEMCCIEPFVSDDSDEAVLRGLREHTRSPHGGFTHEQMERFAQSGGGLELIRLYNCYRVQPQALVATLWRQLSAKSETTLLDMAFAMARLDLGGALAESRREATAVAFLARAP